MIEVYEIRHEGTVIGCGTALELAYWSEQGVFPAGAETGPIIGYEPPSKDERRKADWGIN